MRKRRRLLCSLFIATLAGGASAGPTYEDALRDYDASRGRASFALRAQGCERLASSGDARVLDLLARRYRDPEAPGQQLAYLVADVGTRHLRGAAHVPGYERWLEACHEPQDAWLWSRALAVLAEHRDPAQVLAWGPARRDIHLRAAALEALASRGTPLSVDAALAALDTLPEKGLERGLLLTSVGAAALRTKERLRDPQVQQRITRLIEHVAARATPEWAQLTLARQLSALLGLERPTTRTDTLRVMLEGRAAPPNPETDRYARPRFMGIEATGRRICYVIDLSDSMLIPLTAQEIRDLKRPITPAPVATPAAAPDDGLPWDKIRTRFDAAREFLKLSIRGLDRDQSFAVVTFGTKAGLLDASPGMRPWSKAYAAAVAGALDRIGATGATPGRPHGALQGDTNVHAGFCHALRLVQRGLLDEPEYVARRGYEEGCDTIFLLTDGFPTADDWPGVDEGTRGTWHDPETGQKHEEPTSEGLVTYTGPYARFGPNLMNDVDRLNLFRKAEIHCIGIGEANDHMLKAISERHLGRFRAVGR